LLKSISTAKEHAMRCVRFVLLPPLVTIALVSWPPAADVETPVKADAKSPASASGEQTATESDGDQIRQLIKQLNDDKFAARQAASRELAGRGKAVIPDLTKAATGAHLEVTTRAVELLEQFLKSTDTATRTAAREALDKLASTEHAAAAAAAARVLEKHQTQTASGNIGQIIQGQPFQIVPGPGGIRIAQAQFQFRLQGGQAGLKKFQMKKVNGVTTIDVSEGGKAVKIIDDPNKGISVEVTETKGEKKDTKKYEAKNAAELKKKNPEAHKLYEKYTANNRAGQLRGVQFGGGRIQNQGGAAKNAPQPEKTEKAEEGPDKSDEPADANSNDKATDETPQR
jgi:hypothetical protein